MRVIELDARGWKNVLDYYEALKTALGSPRWHGSSIDAWIDSMIYGQINEIEAPYVVRIVGTENCNQILKADIAELAEAIREARASRLEHYGDDVDVSFLIEP